MNVKLIVLKGIKYIPIAGLKVFLLRHLMGYSIGKNVKIGKAILNCNKVTLGDHVYIADNNTISCNELKIGSNTSIHSGNVIQGIANFTIGHDSRIINNHFFDVSNDIQIGNHTWIAGKGSQFWTHGSIHTKTKKKDLSIEIKNYVYVSSSCSFAPGVVIGSENLIGLGSVVTKSFTETMTIIAGNPAGVVKENIYWRKNW